MLMKLISIQMVAISYQAVMIQLLRYGISDKDIFFTHSMAMKANQHQLLSLHVVIISRLVDLTQLLWFGRATLKKMSKNLSKILEPRQNKNSQVVSHFQRDHQQLPRKQQNHTILVPNLKLTHQSNPKQVLQTLHNPHQEEMMELVVVEKS